MITFIQIDIDRKLEFLSFPINPPGDSLAMPRTATLPAGLQLFGKIDPFTLYNQRRSPGALRNDAQILP